MQGALALSLGRNAASLGACNRVSLLANQSNRKDREPLQLPDCVVVCEGLAGRRVKL